MSASVNARLKLKRDTTANWNGAIEFIPLAGEVIVYTDYSFIEKEINGEIVNINLPAIKIGDGLTYVQDLPFLNEEITNTLLAHIENDEAHLQEGERLFWNNKINVNDESEVINNILIFNRN